MIYNADRLAEDARSNEGTSTCIDGKWVLARPMSGTFRFEKLKAAWLVLRGKADALVWTGQ